jgi:heme oxygenase
VRETFLARYRGQKNYAPPDSSIVPFVERLCLRAQEISRENELNPAYVAQMPPLSTWEWDCFLAYLAAKETAQAEHDEKQQAEAALARQQANLNASLGRR